MKTEAVGTGVMRGGRLDWDNQRQFTEELKEFKDGTFVVVTVQKASERAIRSLKMTRYYFGHVLKLTAQHTGDDKDTLHDFMSAKFLTETKQVVNRETGEVIEQQVVRRYSSLDNEERWDYILKVRLFVGEFLGIETHDPDPDWRWNQRNEAA